MRTMCIVRSYTGSSARSACEKQNERSNAVTISKGRGGLELTRHDKLFSFLPVEAWSSPEIPTWILRPLIFYLAKLVNF